MEPSTPCKRSREAELSAMLARIGHGDRAAFRDLHTLTAPRLLPQAMGIVGSVHSAEEVLQESYMAIWRCAAAFDSARSATFTWMMAIVRNKARDHLRARSRRPRCLPNDTDDEHLAMHSDPAAGPCELAEMKQRQLQIKVGLGRLCTPQRHVIELAYFDDMSHAEIATNMTLPLGTVKTWIRRGCKQMQHYVDASD